VSKRPSSSFRNRLLSALAPVDLARLSPALEPITLTLRKHIEIPNRNIENVCFVEHGIISVVAPRGDAEVEIGLVGFEGVTGLAVVLGSDRSPNSTYVQVEGDGVSIAAAGLRSAMGEIEGLRVVLLKYAQAFLIQTADTAASNASASVEERLARWLLMAHDRVEGNEIALTHEFLALMLGSRRAGVTEAVHRLTEAGMIQSTRGIVVVLDRKALEENAGRFYGVAEKEFDRLIS
jgi:CRP-like cAMP-binding protein